MVSELVEVVNLSLDPSRSGTLGPLGNPSQSFFDSRPRRLGTKSTLGSLQEILINFEGRTLDHTYTLHRRGHKSSVVAPGQGFEP